MPDTPLRCELCPSILNTIPGFRTHLCTTCSKDYTRCRRCDGLGFGKRAKTLGVCSRCEGPAFDFNTDTAAELRNESDRDRDLFGGFLPSPQ